MSEINSLADLRPGDVMFGPIGGAVGVGVGLGQLALGEAFRVGAMSIRHVGIVVETSPEGLHQPRLVQAMPSGAEEIEMSCETHWTDRHAYVRMPEDYDGQAEDAATIARLMVAEGVAYSFASYAALAAWHWGIKTPRLENWIGRRRPAQQVNMPSGAWTGLQWKALPVEAICSVLVDQAWSLAGKRVMIGATHQAVTPGAMARRMFMMVGTRWGGPAWS